MTARYRPRVALWIGGGWVDATDDGDVRGRTAHSGGGITINRGIPDEGGRRADPGSMTFVLNNRHGMYSSRNPRSPYYGLWGRNVPVRVTEGADGQSYIRLPGVERQLVSTPSDSSLNLTGDVDIRIDLTPWTWRLSERSQTLASKWQAVGNQRSWVIRLASTGRLQWIWYPDGINGLGAESDDPVPAGPGERLAVRVTFQPDNGAGGRTTTFYTAPTIDGPWTMLGGPRTNSTSTTSIYASTAPVELGSADGGLPGTSAGVVLGGRVHAFRILDGIDGTPVVDIRDTTAWPGEAEFADGAGRDWTLSGGAEVVHAGTRARMVVPTLPVQWDKSDSDCWVTAEAAGVLQQLNQGSAPEYSALSRTWGAVEAAGYWPLEDAEGSTQGASATPGVGPATLAGVACAADEDLPGSLPTVRLTSSASLVAANVGPMPADVGGWTLAWCFRLAAVPGGTTPLMVIHCQGGTVARWVVASTATGYTVTGYGDDNAIITSGSGAHLSSTPDQWMSLALRVEQRGGDIHWELWIATAAEGATGVLVQEPAGSIGRPVRWEVPGSAGYTDGSLAHVLVAPSIVPFGLGGIVAAAGGHEGERAGDRLIRLGAEEGIPVEVIGDRDRCQRMGRQRPGRLLDLMGECADVDRGYLYETRDTYGLTYRTCRSLYNQAPLELDYRAGLIGDIQPVEDDQHIRNDVAVSRVDGSSARSVQVTGPLNIRDPRDDPQGVGRYRDEPPPVNAASDDQLPHLASWLRALGTVDEPRYPRIMVDLSATAWRSDPDLTAAALAVDTGRTIRISNLPHWMSPDPTEQMVTYVSEYLDETVRQLTWTAVPASPYRVGVLGVSTRLSGRSRTVDPFIAGVDTSLTVARSHPSARLWTRKPGSLPIGIVIAGVRLTVVSVTGDDDPQVLTVLPDPANGLYGVIVPAGEPVHLADPWRLAF